MSPKPAIELRNQNPFNIPVKIDRGTADGPRECRRLKLSAQDISKPVIADPARMYVQHRYHPMAQPAA